MNRHALNYLLVLFALAGLTLSLGCERSPEDLEEFRTSHNQLVEWAVSESEPMPVRVRAVQLLVEEGYYDRLPAVFDEIEDEAVRTELANGAMPAVEGLWEAQDQPELTEEMREEGGRLAVEDLKTARAVDALYHMTPYMSGDAKSQAQKILRDWMKTDQELRTQLTTAAIPLLFPHAGDDAIELLSDWIVETYEPYELVSALRRRASDSDHEVIDAAIVERAREEHPELPMDLKKSINEAESEAIIPYLEEVIVDDAIADDEFFQIAINVIRDVLDEDAPPVLAKAVSHHDGSRRWASATNIVDVAGIAGLITIAEALPTDAEGYEAGQDDQVNSRFTYICNHTATLLDREEIDADPDALVTLLEGDQWPSQVLGIRCAARMNLSELQEEIAELNNERTAIPLWGEPMQVGQYARQISDALAEEE